MKTAEDILNDKRPFKVISVAPEETIAAAVKQMNNANIGAILIEKSGDFVGIWTERDLLKVILDPAFDPKTAIIGEYMKTRLHYAPHDTEVVQLEEMFLGLFIRHILVKKEDRFIGVLSIGDVLRASLLEKAKKIKELNSIASWQYYENWGWDRKKRTPNEKA